jgi:hypothetical protein
MEHITQSHAQRFENGAVTSWEYEMQNANLNVAPISIKGRYPEAGYTSNTVSDSIIHVIGGDGIIELNNGTVVNLAINDQIHLSVGDAYFFEGHLDILYAASPSWTPQQTEHID